MISDYLTAIQTVLRIRAQQTARGGHTPQMRVRTAAALRGIKTARPAVYRILLNHAQLEEMLLVRIGGAETTAPEMRYAPPELDAILCDRLIDRAREVSQVGRPAARRSVAVESTEALAQHLRMASTQAASAASVTSRLGEVIDILSEPYMSRPRDLWPVLHYPATPADRSIRDTEAAHILRARFHTYCANYILAQAGM